MQSLDSFAFYEALGKLVIRRLNFPRHLTRALSRAEVARSRVAPLLTSEDEREIFQTVALVMIRAELPEKTLQSATMGDAMHTLPLSTWKALFSESRRALRIGRRSLTHEQSTAPDAMPEVPSYGVHDVEDEPIRRAQIARRANYFRTCLNANFGADTSRKRASRRRDAIAYLRRATRALAGYGHGLPDGWKTRDAARMAKMRFAKYLAEGEEILTAVSLADAPSFKQTTCLNSLGEIKSFAALA